MADPYYSAGTLDDVMHHVIEDILSHGDHINPTKGGAIERNGVLIELTNPRARLSRTETRGKPFSCLGELCWYLAKTNDLSFILYYLKAYKYYANGDVIFGGYGPRLFDWKGQCQFTNVTELLRKNKYSRKAVIQLFDAEDLAEDHNDIPCTCTLQFMIRNDRLHLFVNMRSNDVIWGLPHDVFSFTMLQEIMARDLCIELGGYKHAVGSLHIYDQSVKGAEQYLNEGWQPTTMPMPPMPEGDPWPAIKILLESESVLRNGASLDNNIFDTVDPYWADLIRLLQVFRYKNLRNGQEISTLSDRMSSDIYCQFIDSTLKKLI